MRAARSKENEVLLLLHKTTEPLSTADIASRLKWLTSSGRPNKSRATHTLERLRGANLVERENGRLVLTQAGQKVARRLERLGTFSSRVWGLD
jgi:Mn-dependent DtxR family transcriptional regulator